MSANEKMPVINEQWHTYNSNLLKWSESIQPCEISESELEKVKNSIKDYWHTHNNPIEVTDLIADYGCDHDGVWRQKLMFKQPSDNNGVITFKEKVAECEHDCNTKSLTCLCPYICKRNRVDEEIDLELIVRRENGNDLEMATKIVQEILKQFSVAKKTTSIDC